MDRIVECVPNFSEGRDPKKIEALIRAVQAVSGVFVLDQEMDHDHHRSVLTLAGEPEAVAEAAVQAARMAKDLIDLRSHQGGHPRVGATDVVPFIPIRGISTDDCVTLARRVGERIGRELGIPVFLYESAATHPDHRNLETIRKGGLEGLATRMASDPQWRPDFGPAGLHPTAGATVVGARPPLIAFNVNLATPDVSIAKAIAKKVRFSSGGLPCVKAIGVDLSSRGVAQVSMNLTNFEETPIHVAYEAVRREAAARGVEVAESEIVGLVPRQALLQAARFGLRLGQFDPSQVLEARLEQVLARETGATTGTGSLPAGSAPGSSGGLDLGGLVARFLEELSSGTPTPGGGSVAALAGALAAGLGIMGCRVGPPADKTGPPEERTDPRQAARGLEPIEQRLLALRDQLQRLIQADAGAYDSVVQAYRLPRTDPARAEAVMTGLRSATEVPMQTATAAVEVVTLLKSLFATTKPSVAPDLKVGFLLGLASIEGALENVAANLKSLKNQEVIRDTVKSVQALQDRLVELKRL